MGGYSFSSEDFSGRTALITGAARGLGREIGQMFHDRGARIILVDIDNRVEQTAADIDPESKTAIGKIADLTDDKSVALLREAVIQEIGDIDTLINNAGAYAPHAIRDISGSDFDERIAINLKTVFLTTQAFMDSLSSTQCGRVVNIASADAYRPKVTNAPYAAAKAGVISLTKSFAAELAPNVLVNGVSPGPIVTETAKTQGWLEQAIDKHPLGYAAVPKDIGRVVLFLASPSNKFMNGETVVVNGGTIMI